LPDKLCKGGVDESDDLDRVNGRPGLVFVGAGGGAYTRTITTAARTATVFVNAATVTAASAGATIVTGPNGGSLVHRGETMGIGLMKRAGPDPEDPAAAWGTELWAQWTGWIVLGSIIPSIIAFTVITSSDFDASD